MESSASAGAWRPPFSIAAAAGARPSSKALRLKPHHRKEN
jgi:hypothetical protein